MPPVRQPGRHVGIPRLQPWGGGQRKDRSDGAGPEGGLELGELFVGVALASAVLSASAGRLRDVRPWRGPPVGKMLARGGTTARRSHGYERRTPC
jgi:hypothetical protein